MLLLLFSVACLVLWRDSCKVPMEIRIERGQKRKKEKDERVVRRLRVPVKCAEATQKALRWIS